jgi:4-hydroxy-2-oxoheptanedioate aldolase
LGSEAKATIRDRLSGGESVFGPFLKIPAPASVEAIGLAGCDFCIIDLEHGPFTFESAEDLVRTAEVSGLSPIIRTFDDRPSTLVRALDTGCEGILVPDVTSREQAEAVVRAARFHPQGERGMDPYARSARYGVTPKDRYFVEANRSVALGVLIEGVDGLENLPKILEVEGIDLYFIGPYDLSQSVGVPGQVHSTAVAERVQEIVDAVRGAGGAAGIYADNAEDARHWRELGVQFVAVSVDVRILLDGCLEVVESLR